MEEFTCPLCLKMLYNPTSIPCGHTFCKICITKSYQRFKNCPICRVPFQLLNNSSVTFLIQSYLEKNFPEEMNQRLLEAKIDEKTISTSMIPVMILENFLLFPGALINLNLFEARYITMIETIMQGDKIMGIITKLDSAYIGYHLEVTTCVQQTHTYMISARIRQRLLLTTASPYDIPEVKVLIQDIGTYENNESIL